MLILEIITTLTLINTNMMTYIQIPSQIRILLTTAIPFVEHAGMTTGHLKYVCSMFPLFPENLKSIPKFLNGKNF